MRRTLLACAALVPALASAAPAKVKIAVMEVRSVQGVAEGTAAIISDIVVSEVARRHAEVVSKSDVAAMVGFEKEKQMLGCSEDSLCLAEIGGALGVDYMLTGQVGQIGSRYRISLLLVDAKRARVAARSARFCDRNEDALAQAAQETVAELMAGVPLPEGAPVAQTAPRPAAAPPPLAPASQTVVKKGPNRTGAWIAFGASGACVLGGVLLGLSAKSKYDDLAALQGDPSYPTIWANESKKIERTARAADGLYLLGVIGAGIGTWLWLSAGPSGSVAVTPVATGEQLGLVASGSF